MENSGLLSSREPYLSLSLIQDQESLISAKFVTCQICNGLIWEPIISKCGDLFCEKCLEFYEKLKINCPKHKNQQLEKSRNISENDILLNQIFDSIKLKCKNYKEGCKCILLYKEIKNHIENKCLYQEIICPNNCPYNILKKDLNEHLKNCKNRKCVCEECGQEYIIKDEEFHKNNCPKGLIKCDNGCGKKIVRDLLNEHKINDCSKTYISCNFCNIKFQRENLKKHNFDYQEQHFLIFDHKFNQLKAFEKNIRQSVDKITNFIEKYQNISINLNDLENRINKNEMIIKKNNNINQIIELKMKFDSLNKQIEQLLISKQLKNQKEEININKDNENQFLNNKRKNSDKNEDINIKNNNNKITEPINNKNIEINKNLQLNTKKENIILNSDNSSITPKITNQNKTYSKSNKSIEKKQNNEKKDIINKTYDNNIELFDKIYKGPNIKIYKSKVQSGIMNNPGIHEFVFGAFIIENNKESFYFDYIITLARTSYPWVAVGLCDKQFIIQNKYKFNDSENGFFGISTNGKKWNSNKKDEFCKQFANINNYDINNPIQVSFEYNFKEKKLSFIYNNSFKDCLRDVYSKESNGLTFCVIFYNSGDSVELKIRK